ncbi:MAG: HlyC/CorC family transporter [Vicinamibacteria bacterium]|nr:HlyC/CorC family transporter [Vicinamibacteria bacterium]
MLGFWLIVTAIFALLLGNGFFSGSEIAIISARKSRIETLASQGSRTAQRLRSLQNRPETFLATAQIGVAVMGTLAGVLGGYLACRHIAPALVPAPISRYVAPAAVATLLVGGGIIYAELILGELLPKALALRFSETSALIVAWPISWLARASQWPARFLTMSTRAVLMLFGLRDAAAATFVSPDEIKRMMHEGHEQGVLGKTEAELIHSVFEFSETPVLKVMVPRPNVFALDIETAPEEALRLIVESGFSRIPAYQESLDNLLGLLYIKDALLVLAKRQPFQIRKLLHPVHFVPESKRVGALLKELQRQRSHMAVVVDEHGSVTGLVTLEDLLEEIVGEIRDEYDWEERPVERLKDGSLVVEGTVSANELRERFDVPIPESSEFETVAGFILARLGAVPKGGEVVTSGGHRLTVVDVERNRICKVKIDKIDELKTESQ